MHAHHSRILKVVVCAACFDPCANEGRCPVEAAFFRLTRESFRVLDLWVQTPSDEWLRLPGFVAEYAALHSRGVRLAPFSFQIAVPPRWWIPPQLAEPPRESDEALLEMEREAARLRAWLSSGTPKKNGYF